ncbi:unnamed protein product [Trichobilharzia regenti]|nr:unnamed protein product [Trichobilharzia regenti]
MCISFRLKNQLANCQSEVSELRSYVKELEENLKAEQNRCRTLLEATMNSSNLSGEQQQQQHHQHQETKTDPKDDSHTNHRKNIQLNSHPDDVC